MPSLAELDAICRKKSLEACPDAIALLARVLTLVNYGASEAAGHEVDRGVQFLTLLLVNRGYNSLYRAFEDILCGFPTQCITLMRSALEDWGTTEYIAVNPEKSSAWLRSLIAEANESKTGIPSFAEIWKVLPPQLSNQIANLYGELSSHGAHPRPEGMTPQIQIDQDVVMFRVGGNFNLQTLRACLDRLISIASCFLQTVERLQVAVRGKATQGWTDAAEEIIPEIYRVQADLKLK